MIETYSVSSSGGILRGSDQAQIPIDEGNVDYRAYLAWVQAGNVPTPYAPPLIYSCQLWQLQAVMTADQWSAVQAAIAAKGDPVLSAFAAHGTNVIPSNSTTLIGLGAVIGLDAAQVAALVQRASAVALP